MNLRVSAEDAGWSIREAAWSFEERVLWRGSDASREALERAGRILAPLQKLIQTRLTWPLSDALRARRPRTRAAVAASAATLALVAAGAGAMTAADHPASDPAARSAAIVGSPSTARVGHPVALQGVAPKFEAGNAPVPAPAPPKPSVPPAQVAWHFAQAFVTYEIGHSSKKTDEAFADTATKQLAKALAADPPRLPAHGKVPQARVLNVVLGAPAKDQLSASVSLVRLRAISELRLTLTKSGRAWRVAQVLG
jgi:hypothetical protein